MNEIETTSILAGIAQRQSFFGYGNKRGRLGRSGLVVRQWYSPAVRLNDIEPVQMVL